MIASLLFMGGRLRSEVSALEWRDVSDASDGVLLTVRTSKTNQEGDAADVRVSQERHGQPSTGLLTGQGEHGLSHPKFGPHPDKASNKQTVQMFRRDVLRELKKIKLAWPELNYSTAPGLLILYPSIPAIAPLNQGQLTS